MFDVNELRPGVSFKDGDEVYTVLSAQHSHQGRGQASVKLKVKSLISGSITMKTVSGGGKFEKAHISKSDATFSYSDGSNLVFMDNESFEQFEIPLSKLEWEKNFIVEGSTVQLVSYEGSVLDLLLKSNVDLVVSETEPGVKGNTATSATKRAVLSTGFEVQVPLFINEGDTLIISTEDGKYSGRNNS